MRAVTYAGVGRLEVAEVPDPQLPPDGAIVRVSTAGVCGTDLHLLAGELPGLRPGAVLGHELVGVVERVGPAASGVRPGQRVVASCVVSCGACPHCSGGLAGRCESVRLLGGGRFLGDLPGAQAELVAVPAADRHLLPVPDEVPDEVAVLLADVLPTAYEAVARAGIAAGDTVVVQGCGPIGLTATRFAALRGAGRVVALDPVADRLAAVTRSGAAAVDVSAPDWAGRLREQAGARGVDVVVDCVGGGPAFDQAVTLVRPGGRVVVVGVPQGRRHDVPLRELFMKAVEVVFCGLVSVPAQWPALADLVAAGRFDAAGVVTHRLPLGDAAAGYRLFADRAAVKVVLHP